MSVTGAAIGAAIAGGILRGFGTNMKIDSQLRELDANEKRLRSNARNARSAFYAQSNGLRMMTDLEQTRLARSHAQRIGQLKGSIGGSGAVADSGTTWDVIVAQDAENQREMNAFKTQSDFKIQDFIDQGDAQYASFMGQADQVGTTRAYLKQSQGLQVFMSMISGGAQGASQGATIASAIG